MAASSEAVVIDPRIAPRSHEALIKKLFASDFFGTPFAPMLATAQVDTLIITGCARSGCGRATASDAMQYGYKVIVPREAVGDRNQSAHAINLSDIDANSGDVTSVGDTLAHLAAPRAVG